MNDYNNYFRHREVDHASYADYKLPPWLKAVLPENKDSLILLIIKGSEMMTLVHELYRRAIDEA